MLLLLTTAGLVGAGAFGWALVGWENQRQRQNLRDGAELLIRASTLRLHDASVPQAVRRLVRQNSYSSGTSQKGRGAPPRVLFGRVG